MKSKIRYILLVVLLLFASVILSGCPQKYQANYTVKNNENSVRSCFCVTVTGSADDIVVMLIGSDGTCAKRIVEKLDMSTGSVTVKFAFFELGSEGPFSLTSDSNPRTSNCRLVVKRVKDLSTLVPEKKITFITQNGQVSMAQAEAKAGL